MVRRGIERVAANYGGLAEPPAVSD